MRSFLYLLVLVCGMFFCDSLRMRAKKEVSSPGPIATVPGPAGHLETPAPSMHLEEESGDHERKSGPAPSQNHPAPSTDNEQLTGTKPAPTGHPVRET